MLVEVITIGDEVMNGEVVDSNFSWIAEKLWADGFDLHERSSVADDPVKMAEVFERGLRSDIVITTGGLGPTSDDRTLEVAAETFGKQLVLDEAALAQIEKRLAQLGRTLNDSQKKQAYHPEGGVMFPNVKGTAPGCRLTIDGTHFIFLVGVPSEMHQQWERDVVPYLESIRTEKIYYDQIIFRCFGAPEAELEEALKDIDLFCGQDAQRVGGTRESFRSPSSPLARTGENFSAVTGPARQEIRLSFRLKFPEVLVRLAAWNHDESQLQTELAKAREEVQQRIGRYIYAEGDTSVEQIIAQLLTERNETVAIAESCTGGLIANMITEIPGASRYFERGVVTYSNQAKENLLGVKAETLMVNGAVSEPTAREMVEGICKRAGTTYGIAVTGIAGPDGGTDDKPVGTVFVALATPDGTKVKKHHFPFGRHWFKIMVAHVALHRLRRRLVNP